MDLLTSGLWEWSHLVDIRFRIGPVNLHRDKLLFRARRRGEGAFRHGFWWSGQRFWRRRGSGEWRRRWRQRRNSRRLGASTRRLDPWERANVVLGDSREVSNFYEFFSGRYSLFNCCVVPGGVSGGFSFVVQRGRDRVMSRLSAVVLRRGGSKVEARVGRFRWGAFLELFSFTLVPAHPRWGRGLERRGRFGCSGLYVILKWEDIFITD